MKVFSLCGGLQFHRQRVRNTETDVGGIPRKSQSDSNIEKGEKGERRMPRLPEAMKDVVSCEKVRGSANGI